MNYSRLDSIQFMKPCISLLPSEAYPEEANNFFICPFRQFAWKEEQQSILVIAEMEKQKREL